MGLQINGFKFNITDAMVKQYITEFLQNTPEGKKYNIDPNDVTMGDLDLTSTSTFIAIINDLIDILWQHIKYDTITESGQGLYYFPRTSIYFVTEENPKGGYDAYICFDANSVKRKSLYPKGYPKGIQDIIKLFTTGYTAKKHVYGTWNRTHGNNNVKIRSLLHRDPNDFLEEAVKEFNRDYMGRARARVLPEYMR